MIEALHRLPPPSMTECHHPAATGSGQRSCVALGDDVAAGSATTLQIYAGAVL